MTKAALALATVLIAGCAANSTVTNYYDKPASEVAKAVTVSDSEFDPVLTYLGPQLRSEDSTSISNTDYQVFRFRAWQAKTPDQRAAYQLYVELIYSSDRPRLYHWASFSGGHEKSLELIQHEAIRCNASGSNCLFGETVGINLEEHEFLAIAPTGLKVRLNAKNFASGTVLEVPAPYMEGLRLAIASRTP